MIQVGSAEPGVIPHEGFSSDSWSFRSGSPQRLCFPTPLQLEFRIRAHGSPQPPSCPSSPYPQAIPCWDHRAWPEPELSTTACNNPMDSFPFPSLLPKSRDSAVEGMRGLPSRKTQPFLSPLLSCSSTAEFNVFGRRPLNKSCLCFTSL